MTRPAEMAVPLKMSITPTGPKPPPVADYIVKIPHVPVVMDSRDYADIARRYPHLHISPDFTKIVSHWAKVHRASALFLLVRQLLTVIWVRTHLRRIGVPMDALCVPLASQ